MGLTFEEFLKVAVVLLSVNNHRDFALDTASVNSLKEERATWGYGKKIFIEEINILQNTAVYTKSNPGNETGSLGSFGANPSRRGPGKHQIVHVGVLDVLSVMNWVTPQKTVEVKLRIRSLRTVIKQTGTSSKLGKRLWKIMQNISR